LSKGKGIKINPKIKNKKFKKVLDKLKDIRYNIDTVKREKKGRKQ
jgi:predicted CoA-binding protein